MIPIVLLANRNKKRTIIKIRMMYLVKIIFVVTINIAMSVTIIIIFAAMDTFASLLISLMNVIGRIITKARIKYISSC